jgi:hypothetical protein
VPGSRPSAFTPGPKTGALADNPVAAAWIPGKALAQERLQTQAEVLADLGLRDTQHRNALAVAPFFAHVLDPNPDA